MSNLKKHDFSRNSINKHAQVLLKYISSLLYSNCFSMVNTTSPLKKMIPGFCRFGPRHMYWPAVNYLVPSVFQHNNFLNQVQIRYASWIYGSESMFLTDLEQKIRLAPKVPRFQVRVDEFQYFYLFRPFHFNSVNFHLKINSIILIFPLCL
jgi:hypothetical protein